MDDRSRPSIERAVETMALGTGADGAPEDRRAYLSVGLIDLLAVITGLPSGDVPEDAPLVVNSLQAAEMCAVLDAAFGVSVPMSALVSGVSVPAVVDLLLADADPDSKVAQAQEVLPDPGARFEPFELSDVQQAYLLGRDAAHELGNVDSSFYVELATVDLDVDRFERALRATIERHDMLRAVIDGDGRQRVLAEVPAFVVTRTDLSALPEFVQQERIDTVRAALTTEARDVGRWPLFDVRTSRLDERRGLVHIGMDLLICDGASFATLVQEIATRYADPQAVLPELELTFRDYQRTQALAEGGERQEQARRYWGERLDLLPPAPALPLAKPLAAIDQPRFVRRHLALVPEQWQRFQALAAERQISASAALAAAFTDVLARWSRSTDFTLNVTVNNRRPVHDQVRDVIGDFTSLSLLEVHSDPARAFTERAGSLQRQLWEDLDHSEFSGVRVMRELARRSGPATAVVPVVFSTFVGTGFADDFAPPWLAGLEYTLAQAPQLSLECLVMEFQGGLNLTWDTVDEAFPEGVLDDMFAAFTHLVQQLADDAAAWAVTETVPLPQPQLAVRQEVNRTQAPVPERLLHRLGTALGERSTAPAVVTGEHVISYGDLDRMACRVGRGLRRSGALPNRLVAVVMEKGWEQVVAVLGVLYSGAAYLPIDAALPADRIRRLLALGGVEVVLTQKAVRDRLDWDPALTVLNVSDPSRWWHEEDAPLEDVQSANDLAYVIFTSGSTGEPKGVAIDHLGAANTTADINNRFAIGPSDRVLALSSLSFDLSVWDVFGVLAAGGTVVLPSADAGRDPQCWAELVKRHHVTVWNTVPALMQMFTTHAETRPEQNALHPLRLVLMSGDWIETSLADRIRAQHPGPVEIVSLGGATEASIWSIHHPIGARDARWASVPYGTPLANQTFHVLDEHMRPCPEWVTGRLFIGGIGLAQGYWGSPEQTARRFVTDPHTGERRYDTGDLGRYRPGGVIEFLGREDGQVKVNGYRIELGEVEHTLGTHPQVRRAVAVAEGNRLLSYVTTSPRTPGELDNNGAHVADWHQVFDSLRAGEAAQTAGWTDSFTGEPIADADMAQWADITARRVLAHRPRRVLEIGCGAGLIATRLVTECAEYVGTDLSERTLQDLARRLQELDAPARTTLLHREALDLTGIAQGHFDCVVINSVAQYFPSADYLLQVVRGALGALRPGGVLYLGDVRDLRLLRPFHTAIERCRAQPQDTVRDVAWRLEQRELAENELAVDPLLLWSGLERRVSVLPRPGSERTEMADYRFDVLVFGEESATCAISHTLAWAEDEHPVAAVRRLLERWAPTVRLTAVPNRRLYRDIAFAEQVSAPAAGEETLARLETSHAGSPGTSMDELSDLAAEFGYHIEFFQLPETEPGDFDAVFARSSHDLLAAAHTYSRTAHAPADTARLANSPLAARDVAALPARLLRHAAKALPSYMVPAEVFVLASMPLTSNGKVDTGRLREIASRHRARPLARADSGPRNAVEHRLAGLWQQVLGQAPASVHEDFFQAGGDSLLAVRLVRAAAARGLVLTVAEVFAHPTIARLAELASAHTTDGPAPEEEGAAQIAPRPGERFEPFPLTDLQQAYLLGRNGFFDLGNVAASFYIELSTDDLDADRLAAAVDALVRRHDMLRAHIGPDGRWHVRPEADPYRIEVADLRHLDPASAEAETARIRSERSGEIFDPTVPRLFDVRASRLHDGFRIHVTLDLLIADGGTVRVFLTELAARYADPEAVWPELELTFRDYGTALAEAADDPRHLRAREYWSARIPHLPPGPRLPLAADPADIDEPRFTRLTHRLPNEAWKRLRQAASAHGTTPSAVLATAYAQTLAAWSDSSAFTLNVTVDRRLPLHPEVPDLIGDFTAVTLLAVDLDAAAGFADRARALQAQLALDLDHNEYTGIKVLRQLAREHGPERATMPVVFTSALDTTGTDYASAASALGRMVHTVVHTPQVHLDHQAYEYDGELVLNWDAVEQLFNPHALDQAFHAYVRALEELADDASAWARTTPVALTAAPAPTLPTTAAPAANDHGANTPAPNAVVERLLTGIWSQVLGIDVTDTTAEFTRLGGDSLLAMQVISRAAAAGWSISPRDFFAHRTITGIAATARPSQPAPQAAGTSDGTVVLLPRQLAMLEEVQEPEQLTYVLLFDLDEPLDRTALKAALRAVLRRHDALRTAFVKTADGWSAQVRPADGLALPLTWVDAGPAADSVEDVLRRLRSAADLAAAPLLHVAAFQSDKRQQILLVISQLVCDNYSCRLLCEDLLTAYRQVAESGEAALAPAGSASAWARLVHSRATDPQVLAELPYWQGRSSAAPAALPQDAVGEGTAVIALDPQVTAAIEAAGDVPDVLLAAIARAIARRTGEDTVRVDVEGHGRDLTLDALDPALNPARILGRLSTRWPLKVPAPLETSLADAAAAAGQERLQVPAGGTHYELLAQTGHLRTAAPATATFNYLGHADALWTPLGLSPSDDQPAPRPAATTGSPRLGFLTGVVAGHLVVACSFGSAELLHEIGTDITTGILGRPAPLTLPAELDALRHWLGH